MDIELLIVSFVAGVLTVLAPCTFPLLPILLGSSSSSTKSNKAFTVIISLLVTITLLTLAIHGASSVFSPSQGALRLVSGLMLGIIGLFTVLPHTWEQISNKLSFGTSSNKLLGKFLTGESKYKYVLIGVALGPVFSSCSPTYGVIIATILPQSFLQGLIYLLVYMMGLGLILAMVAILGQRFTSRLAWATDPNGWFKRIIGLVFLVIGIALIFNLDKTFETWLLQGGIYNSLTEFELNLRN